MREKKLQRFFSSFPETLTLLQKKKRSIYIAGDFNFDLLKINETP